MGDDGIGPRVAYELIKRGYDNVVICGPDLAPVFARLDDIDLLIIVDAMDWGAEPGSLMISKLNNLEEKTSRLSHALPLTQMLRIMKKTLKESMEVYIIGVQPKCIEPGSNLTPPVEHAVDEIIAKIEELLRERGEKKVNT